MGLLTVVNISTEIYKRHLGFTFFPSFSVYYLQRRSRIDETITVVVMLLVAAMEIDTLVIIMYSRHRLIRPPRGSHFLPY